MSSNSINFSAHMMCSGNGCLKGEIRALEHAGIDSFHVDIMDGKFIYDFCMEIHDLRYISSVAKKVHLMIRKPVRYVEMFAKLGAGGFILGIAALFGKHKPYREILSELRDCGK